MRKAVTIASHQLRDRSEKTVEAVSWVFLSLFTLVALLPCLHVLSKSISSGTDVTAGQILFWPRHIQVETIQFIWTGTNFPTALKNSLIVTVMGTVISLLVTITTAYPLSKRSLRGMRFVSLLYVFSMVFYGGIVPAYMVVNSLGLIDTYWALILPFAIVQFNMFIVKNFFESLPEEIEESARIDGAGDLRILCSIVCPMALPAIATVGLLYAVNYWNNYVHAMMYTRSPGMKTLQVFLYDILANGSEVSMNVASGTAVTNLSSQNLVAGTVTLSAIPIIVLYPFVQRFLMKGLTIGSVKG